MDRSQRCRSANTLDIAYTKQAEAIEGASIMAIGDGAALRAKKYYGKGKGKKRVGVAEASVGASVQPYTPVKLLSSREAHLKAIVAGLEAANAVLPSPKTPCYL